MIDIRMFDASDDWIQAVADDFLATLAEKRYPGPLRLCLAGGRTPEPVYRAVALLIAEGRAGPEPVLLVPGDERVPTGDPADLNDTMLRRSFATALASGSAILYRWFDGGEGAASADSRADPDREAYLMIQAMEGRLAPLVSPGRPLFDLCYLGLGADGHTAGLFPGMPGLRDKTLCVRGLAPMAPRQRVSLGFPALVSCAKTRFLIQAKGKEAALARLGSGDRSCPAVRAATGDTRAYVLA